MHKIIVIGCPGSGKSTLSAIISQKLSLPLVHLDSLFWKSGWKESTQEEFDAKLMNELNKDCWVIDGNYNRTMNLRMRCADTVIYLDYPARICLWRVIKRVIKSYGKTRPDMGEECPERFDIEFMRYIAGFNKREKEKIIDKLKTVCENKKIIIIRNEKDRASFIDMLENR